MNMKKLTIWFSRVEILHNYNLDDLHVQLSDVHLTRVHTTCTKFLGVHIDDSLGWKSHVSYVASIIASVLGILHVVKKMLP